MQHPNVAILVMFFPVQRRRRSCCCCWRRRRPCFWKEVSGFEKELSDPEIRHPHSTHTTTPPAADLQQQFLVPDYSSSPSASSSESMKFEDSVVVGLALVMHKTIFTTLDGGKKVLTMFSLTFLWQRIVVAPTSLPLHSMHASISSSATMAVMLCWKKDP